MPITREDIHRTNLGRKHEQLEGLKALYEEWRPFKDEEDEYMMHLKKRIKVTENQLRNMRP